MVAMVLIGMTSLWWGVILGVVVLIYKLSPPCASEMSWSFAPSRGSRRDLHRNGLRQTARRRVSRRSRNRNRRGLAEVTAILAVAVPGVKGRRSRYQPPIA